MVESSKPTGFESLRCPRCAGSSEGLLTQTAAGLECTELGCGMVYPIQDGVAVMLSYEGDFYHLRKALSPADIRVHRQSSE